jgi:hypothetical protein
LACRAVEVPRQRIRRRKEELAMPKKPKKDEHKDLSKKEKSEKRDV